MRVLINSTLTSGFLGYFPLPDHVQVKIKLLVVLDKVDNQYVERLRGFRLLKNYIGKIGVWATMTKILSRLKERQRNKKYIVCGVGRVFDKDFLPGRMVLFVLPNHPKCTDTAVIPKQLVFDAENIDCHKLLSDKLYFFEKPFVGNLDCFKSLRAWSYFSGINLESLFSTSELYREVSFCVNQALENIKNAIVFSVNDIDFRYEKNSNVKLRSTSLSAAIYGYGNYTKTCIIPNLNRKIQVLAVHEIDPLQLGKTKSDKFSMSTSPFFDDSHAYDLYFIAGFHHTHADLAIKAIEAGSAVVVEKPVATTQLELDRFKQTLLTFSEAKVFVCFQKRYTPFNDYIYADLSVSRGEAINFHCIVFEEKLPKNHWYHWPNSCSRLVSNGCHWIDYFLFLNCFSKIASSQVSEYQGGALLVSLTLENGAIFSMLLTDDGSHRVGVQDYIELRSSGATAKIINNQYYFSENNQKVLRRFKCNKMLAYRIMYRRISDAVCDKAQKGDSFDSLTYTAEVVLSLEEKLKSVRKK